VPDLPRIPLTIVAPGGETDGVLVAVAAADLDRLEALAGKLAVALILTQEYVGSDVLPPIEGWSWYDALCEFYGEPFVPADCRERDTDPTGNEVALTDGR
jgi:hypothetical protein